MGSFLSSVPQALQDDLDATFVDVEQCARQLLEYENHLINPSLLGVYKNVTEAHEQYVRVLAWDCINFCPGKVLSGGGDGRVCVWDEDQFCQLGCIETHTSVRSLCVTPGCWISGHSDGLVVAWDAKSLQEVARLNIHQEAVYALLYIPQFNYVISGAEQIAIWHKQSHSFTEVDYLQQEVLCIASSENWLFTGQMDATIGVWEIPVQTGRWPDEPAHTLLGHTRSVWALVAIPSRGLVASGSADSSMRIWKVGTMHCVKVLDFDSWVVGLSFGGCKLVSASNDGMVKVWNVDLWVAEKSFPLDGEVYCCLVFGGGRIASGGAARSIIVYREASSLVPGELDRTYNTRVPAIESDKTPERKQEPWVNPFEFSMSEFQVVQALNLPTE